MKDSPVSKVTQAAQVSQVDQVLPAQLVVVVILDYQAVSVEQATLE